MAPALLSTLPSNTWGAAWASAPPPGSAGNSNELIAIWGGMGAPPTLSADYRVPSPIRYLDRAASGTHFASAAGFKSAVAARQTALGRDVVCFDSTGTRYADLNTNFGNATEGIETRDVLRISDSTKVGEAVLFRSGSSETTQHWVMRTSDRFDDVRVVKRPSGEYASLTAFLNAQASARPQNASWPHVVEVCTHYFFCPW
jgi:hypothetical protein